MFCQSSEPSPSTTTDQLHLSLSAAFGIVFAPMNPQSAVGNTNQATQTSQLGRQDLSTFKDTVLLQTVHT